LPVRLADPAFGPELLLGHVQYRDPYTGPPSREVDARDIHGPYRLDQISLRSYEVVDEATALRTIRDFVGNEDGLSDDVRGDLDFRSIGRSSGCPFATGFSTLARTRSTISDGYSAASLLLLVAAAD
jgi:hypothetical protein